jgi:parallel beta-helix repeat protein
MLPEDAAKINDDASMLQTLIDRAIDSNQKTLRLPAGTYRIGQMLRIENATDLAIDASGVTVIMTQWEPVLNFHKCSGVTFTGMTVDYDPLPFTQGVVTSVEPDGVRFEMQLDKGYPTYEQMGKRVHLHVFDPVTRYWKADVWDMYPQEVTSLGDGKLQVTPSKAESNLAVGDLIAIDTRTSRAMNVTRSRGPNTFKDITFLTAPGLVICGRECDAAQTFDHIVIKRGPLPAGATSPRLMSSSADGINFAYSRVGPVLENCDFSYMGDDSLNVHGALLPVMMVPDARTLIVARLSNNDIISRVILPGDPIRILTRDTFAIEKQLKVVKVETYQGKRDIDFQQMQKDFFTSTITRARSENYTLFAVTVDQDHGAAVMQQVIDFPTFNCSGYVVRNNYFHDHRARGLRLMGNDGLVEGNTFERLGQCAISIGAEMGYWAEAGWVQNVTIRNNTIRDVNRDRNATSESSLVLGAIGTFLHTNVKTPPFLGHRKITIQNNTIDGSGTAGIYLYGADEVTVTGNTIVNTNTRDASITGSAWGLTVTKPLEVHSATKQVIKDNIIK